MGASAGGLEAFTSLLTHLPANTGMAFVLVQHLDPKRDSMLRDILARSTDMPIQEVRGGMAVRVNQVYVSPANADVSLIDGSFKLRPRKNDRHDTPIDHFFTSLADLYKSRAIGVVLSGTLSDGALGMRAIKAEGGVTFAQDEKSARFPDMPRAAIAAGAVDFVYPPAKIAAELVHMGKHPYVRPQPKKPPPEALVAGTDHQRILVLIRTTTGVDFSSYRQTTVKRRIARRMALRNVDSLRKYYEILRKEPAEIHALHEDILITVTSFFRDPGVFKTLKARVFPSFLKDRGASAPIRIWVPGCATGEEVYSIAITLFETLQETERNPPIQIFATDISETAIDKARAGIYLDNAVAEIPPERLRRFFVETDAGWQISKSIRDVCVFARQDITSDPPFSNLDLISCRNLLIYLEPALQKRVLPIFHYALRPRGHLLLGTAESIQGFGDLFVPIDRNHRVFAKRPGSSRQFFDFGPRQHVDGAKAEAAAVEREGVTPVDLQKEADRMVIGRYGPAGVVINDSFEIIQFRGKTSPYLEAAPGAASFNLLKMAREGLLVELRSAVLKARKTGRPLRCEGLHVRQDGHLRDVNLEIVPIKPDQSGIHHFLILFEDAGKRPRGSDPTPPAEKRPRAEGRSGHEAIVKLEQELTATKDYLQSIIEEQEASNEELKSANEEILSSNEELQSTNEELETAKEELQSTNEELTTVNEELQNRNLELSQVNNDLVNILTGTDVAIVMLGAEGRIRRYTPQAEKLLNLIPSDIGRPIRDIKPAVNVPDLAEIIADVVNTVGMREREIQDEEGNWYQMQARPYRTLDNRIDGAVVVFFDIDPMKRSLEQVHRARDYAEALVETVREGLVVLDEKLRVRTSNQSFHRIFESSASQTEGKDFAGLWGLERAEPALRPLLERMVREKAPIEDYDLALDLGTGEKSLLLNARRVRLPGETQPVFLLAIEDVTERRAAELGIRTSEARYRRIFETAREGIWLMDARNGVLLDVNPFLEELLGWSKAEMVGKKPWDLGLYDDSAAARGRFEANLAGGLGFEQEVLLRTKSGERVVVEAVTNTYDLGGRLVTQANLRDVSERARLQEQVRQMQKLDSIGRLAGGVAHDFNNLLNIISAHVGILGREKVELAKRAESAASIQKAVERGSAVVRQLLTFARKSEVAFEPTDVNVVLREVASMLRETLPKQIRVTTKLAEEVPRVHADPNQLHQAILNLAVNARDAMPHGGVLTLGTDVVTAETLRAKFPEASGGRFVELCVSDTGLGMDSETRRRIFEPFFTTKGAKGQGLGLAVVYGIVNSHRGFVDVESEVGRGTTFRIYIEVPEGQPLADAATTGRRKSARRNTAAVPRAGKPPSTLLLVEDEEALLNPVRDLLEEEGFEVLTALDGREAVRVHSENADKIGVVLLDLGLPRLGGWEAFLKMRERDPSLRCIVASGNIDADQRSLMEEAGVQASVRKPYGIAEILRVVRSVLES